MKALNRNMSPYNIEGTNLSIEFKKSIDEDSHDHEHSHEDNEEDVRKKWTNHLAYDPKSIA